MRHLKYIVAVILFCLFPMAAYAANLTTTNSTFDTNIDTYTTLSDNSDFILAQHINGPMSAIINIENILGTGLKGSQATLSARLSQMISGAGGINSGTSFPTTPTPVNAQLFWRSDLKALYIYDGALGQWQQLQIPSTFNFSSPSAYTLTLYHNNTAGRTITFPDITDTLVTLTATQTLTNKTIDDANNTLTILETSITDGALLARLAANETITGAWIFAPTSGNTVFSAGNVGIGISNPTGRLTIRNDGGSNNQFIRLENSEVGHLRNWVIGPITASSGALRIFDATANESRVEINSAGNVYIQERIGIGITPSHALHVEKSIAGDAVAKIRNTSVTGYGLKIVPGADSSPYYALGIGNTADTAVNIVLRGDGSAKFSNDVTIDNAAAARLYLDDTGGNGHYIVSDDSSFFIGVTNTPTAANDRFILTNNVRIKLGDAAGANLFRVDDNNDVNVFSINSDGAMTIASTAKVTNLNSDMVDGKYYSDLAANNKMRANRITGVSISNATWTKVVYDVEEYDPSTIHSSATGCVSIPAAGYYLITASGTWGANATGTRDMRIAYGTACGTTTTVYAYTYVMNNGASYTVAEQINTVAYLNPAYDFVWVEVRQDSGGALSFGVAVQGANVFTVTRLDKIPQ